MKKSGVTHSRICGVRICGRDLYGYADAIHIDAASFILYNIDAIVDDILICRVATLAAFVPFFNKWADLKLDDDMLNIPLFMADQTDRLIGLALEDYAQKH